MAVSKDIIPKNFNGYKRDEPIEGHYLRVPKDLNSPQYKDLNSDAKLIYAFLLDRMELSRKNGWTNDNNDLYVLFSREELGRLLNISLSTVKRAIQSLKKANLIYEVRQGAMKPNLIYIGKVKSSRMKDKIEPSLNTNLNFHDGSNLPTNYPDLNYPDLNKPDVNNIRDFSVKPEKPSPSLNNKNDFSEWNRITALKFPNSITDYTLKRFIWEYKRNMKQDHPSLKNQQIERAFKVLRRFYIDNDISNESDMDVIIAKYFKTNFPNANNGKGCDYNFNHFATEGVLQNRFWEELL